RVRTGAPALLAFALLAAPNVVALSGKMGRLSFGEWSSYDYAVYVNGVPSKHWRGEEADTGAAAHPTRKIVGRPATYEFAEPVAGTYPVFYDASYWYDGIRVRFLLEPFSRA